MAMIDSQLFIWETDINYTILLPKVSIPSYRYINSLNATILLCVQDLALGLV